MNINKIDWQKIVGRRADLQKAIQFSCNGAGGFGRFFEIEDLARQLYYFDGRTTSIYFSEKEYAGFLKKAHDKLDDIQFVKKCGTEIINVCKKCIESAEVLSKTARDDDMGSLQRIFEGFNNIWNDFYPIAWPFFFIVGFETGLKQKLMGLGFGEKEANEILEISARSDCLTPVLEAEVEILRLAKIIKSGGKNIQELAQELSSKFGWMSVYNTEDQIRQPDYYLREAQEIITTDINIEDKIRFIEDDIEKNEKAFSSYLKNISDKLLREQLKFLHVSGYLRDKREEARDRITILEKPLYAAIAGSCNLSVDEVVYLSNAEIINLIRHRLPKNELQETAQKRMKKYVFVVDHGNLKVIDNEAEISEIARLFGNIDNFSEIKGQVAYKQSKKVRGTAKIVFSNKELAKVKEGDVLVAPMTKPDFLTVMKKAAAFVTDEGGITCHAAIVAREMKKPCIIGTKIATQALKDGDMVEVDANQGIVKIIERVEKK